MLEIEGRHITTQWSISYVISSVDMEKATRVVAIKKRRFADRRHM